MDAEIEPSNLLLRGHPGGGDSSGLAYRPRTTKRPAIPYLGSKVRHGGRIAEHIASVVGPGARVADVFSGTATMSANLKGLGMSVVANDNLLWAFHAASAKLLNTGAPTFDGVDVPTDGNDVDRYGAVLQFLNGLPPVDGFWVREYSPAGPDGRLYFTMQNAGSIGAIRRQISAWSDCLTPGEFSLLITDLCAAASAVANTAAHFRTYLRDRFKPNALCPLQLRRGDFTRGAPDAIHQVYRGDSNALVRGLDVDAVYADPPYNKREYGSYYHILETIAAGDEPSVEGKCGIRPWPDLSSSYCKKGEAAGALADLVANSGGRHFFLGYGAGGHLRHSQILEILGAHGEVSFLQYYKRGYRSSGVETLGARVIERLYHLDRARSW